MIEGMPVSFHPDAVEEIEAAIRWYANRSRHHVRENRIEVLAVAYGHRRPGYRRERME